MSQPDPVVQLENVSKSFPGPGGAAVPVLRDISLEVGEGESLAVIGPSGSGKSTLLSVMGTLDKPTAGEVRLEGRRVDALEERELAQVRNRLIGFVFQLHHLLPQCTVLENVLVPTLVCENEVVRDSAPDRARRLLERVGLGDRLDHRPGMLSGGERQRAAVVRALINEPRVLLADEPTGSLDQASARSLANLLVELNQETRTALVVVTHSPELARRMSRILELREGALAEVGPSRGGAVGGAT